MRNISSFPCLYRITINFIFAVTWTWIILIFRRIVMCVILLIVFFSLWSLSESFLLSLEIDSLFFVEGLSSVSSFLCDVLACRIPASRYWVTLLFLRFSYLWDDYLASSGWDDSVKDFCEIMVKITLFLLSYNSIF